MKTHHIHQNRIWIGLRAGIFVLCLALGLASCRKSGASAEESSLFVGDAAQKAMKKIVSKMPSTPRIFSIDIQPEEMRVIVRSTSDPNHLDEYRYVRAGRELFWLSGVSGPTPAQPVIINPNLEENLFDLAEVNLAAVAETGREASRRLALDGGGTTVSIRIQRQVSIEPHPHSGAIVWNISVRSPRESASATADAQGHIRRINLRGTRRAKMVDYTKGGEPLAAALKAIREEFGTERIFKEISISRGALSLAVRDPKNPTLTLGYVCDLGGLEQGFNEAAHTRKQIQGELRETQLFGLDEADWTRVPALAQAGLGKVPLPDGRVSYIALMRRVHPLEEYPADWKVHVSGGGESGSAYFDAKSGELTELDLPKSLIKSVAYLEPENTRRILATILEDFGPETRFIELWIGDERALVTATRPKHPNDLRRYGYTATERAKLGKHPPLALDDPKARDRIFTHAEAASFVPQLDKLIKRAFERLGMKDGKLQNMSFQRKHMVKNLLVEFRCDSPTVGDGYIVYELSGKEFYAAIPDRAAPTDSEIAALFDEWQAVLKIDAAAGDKVQATRWFKATRNGATHNPSREEMREYYEAERGLIETTDRVLAFLMQPRIQAKMAELFKFADVRGVGDRKMFDLEFWRVSRRRTVAAYELKKLQVKHWNEIEAMLRNPPSADAKVTAAWQKTFLRLTQEEEAARKERDAIVAKHQPQ